MNDEYLEFAKTLAREAGEIMLKHFSVTNRDWKADSTPVTQADTEINSLVIHRVKDTYPEHSVLGEEESHNLGNTHTWVCDPVDGTVPYSHGVPVSTFSIALCIDGVPTVGVVYDPFMDRLFYAAKDSGAFCNDTKLHVSTQGMEHALIDVEGFPSTKPVIPVGSEITNVLVTKGALVQSLWAVILPACLLASGEYTGIIFNVPKPEDPAAVKVIIEEAGGKVTDLFGNDQRYDQPVKGFIASNGVIHDELVEIIKGATK